MKEDEEVATDPGAVDPSTDRLAEPIAAGIARPPSNPERHRPSRSIRPEGSVSDLVSDQRR